MPKFIINPGHRNDVHMVPRGCQRPNQVKAPRLIAFVRWERKPMKESEDAHLAAAYQRYGSDTARAWRPGLSTG